MNKKVNTQFSGLGLCRRWIESLHLHNNDTLVFLTNNSKSCWVMTTDEGWIFKSEKCSSEHWMFHSIHIQALEAEELNENEPTGTYMRMIFSQTDGIHYEALLYNPREECPINLRLTKIKSDNLACPNNCVTKMMKPNYRIPDPCDRLRDVVMISGPKSASAINPGGPSGPPNGPRYAEDVITFNPFGTDEFPNKSYPVSSSMDDSAPSCSN